MQNGKEAVLLTVLVDIHVKPECVEAFRKASMENALQSRKEPGVARFDILQRADDSTRFTLVEAYRTADDPARHKETAHYKKWRETVEAMMAIPRTSQKFAWMNPE